MKDALMLAAEWSARQIYWRSPRLRAWQNRRRRRARPMPQTVHRRELMEHLDRIGATAGALVMVHTSVSGVVIRQGNEREDEIPGPVQTANRLVDCLCELVGPTGTLVMPTHARYQSDESFLLADVADSPLYYDPATTPSSVGLANELFRRRPDALRSLHPINTLSARGPMAEELFRDNLNDSQPLPHGVHSGYYRFCRHNGLVFSVGVPLGVYMTLIHVAEDVRDHEWSVPNFWRERPCVVRIAGEDKTFVVREKRPEYGMFCLCIRKVARDLLRAGILHEASAGGVRVDWARSGEVFEYFMARNRTSSYPYFLPQIVRAKGYN